MDAPPREGTTLWATDQHDFILDVKERTCPLRSLSADVKMNRTEGLDILCVLWMQNWSAMQSEFSF